MNVLICMGWFMLGFLSVAWFNYMTRTGAYTVADLFIIILFSFLGPMIFLLILLVFIADKLSEIKITKD
jgi:hypothetical protein